MAIRCPTLLAFAALGYQRKGGRIVDTLTRVIRTVRSQSGVKLTIENVVPEPRQWGDGACSVIVFFTDGSKGDVATTLNASRSIWMHSTQSSERKQRSTSTIAGLTRE